ncbi:MAG: tetratricopeptide repeat protein [Pedobacter sp.]|nr:MAG: tetratricopeptide repeat protein [Pedobacter sp.]
MPKCSLRKIILSICFVLFVLVPFQVLSQSPAQRKLDSLLNVLNKYPKEDSLKMVHTRNVARQYGVLGNEQKIIDYTDLAIKIALKNDLKQFVGHSYIRLGLFYHGKLMRSKAEAAYNKAIDAYKGLNLLDDVGGVYLNLGALYILVADYPSGIAANQQAIDIFLKTGNQTDLASCYSNIVFIYNILGQHSKSLQFAEKALTIFQRGNNNVRGIAVTTHSMANIYKSASKEELLKMGIKTSEEQFAFVIKYLTIAERSARIENDPGILAGVYEDLGDAYDHAGKKADALKAFETAVKYSSENELTTDLASNLNRLSNFYIKYGETDKAVKLLNQALELIKHEDNLTQERDIYLSLSNALAKNKNYDQALSYYQKYISVKDRIFNQEKEKELTRKAMQLDFGVRENEYVLKQRITDGELKQQVLVAAQQQQQLKLRQQQLILSDQEKSLQRLDFLRKQAELQGEKKMQAANFEKAQLVSKYAAIKRDEQIGKQEQQIKFDQRLRLFLYLAIAMVLTIAGIIYFNQLRTRKLNRIIVEQKQELEQLNKVKDKIFSVVSHDMRTPVNSLISFINLLENGTIEQEKLNRYAASLKNSLSYTSTMMENLLNWAASQMDGFYTHLELLDISPIAHESVGSFKTIADAKGIKLINNIQEGTICTADENMITLIFRNLLSNAVKFTPDKGTITLSSEVGERSVEISISDTGVGMSQAQLDHFNKVGKYMGGGLTTPGTNNEKGTGLGLLLCRTFTLLMNGNIHANNNGKGTTFVISLQKQI